jgi:hypothetical protein
VRKCNIPPGKRPLNSHLFMVEKFKADGMHNKFKSRLVSHGSK